MRTTLIFLCFIFFLFSSATKAQSFLDKLGTSITKANNTKANLDKVKGWLPKKKTKTDTTVSVAQPATVLSKDTSKITSNKSMTVVSITGIDFSRLKTLNENIRACSNVISTSMKYNSSASTIEVIHNGSTEDLLKLMGETSKDIFTDKNLSGFEDGKIALKL